MANEIQKEINTLFFRDKKVRPGGLDAFSAERVTTLESEIARSENEAIRYYVLNREFLERSEDHGGGYRIIANGKRLVPYLKTKPGRRKLFQMDRSRVQELIARPCFASLEDCGEESSDASENGALLQEFNRKYAEPEFLEERKKVIRDYLNTLLTYGGRFKSKTVSRFIGSEVAKVQRLLDSR
ncbi:MAG: hypothetical protein H7301_10645 [Cryobacterium sp.]|nr:hypothetical protein [Oligoflexia bacterium]